MAIDSFFNGEFFNGEFFKSGSTPVVTIDTHDGFDSERKHDEAKREARERLREQIATALDGPQAVEVRKALTPYSKKSDALPFLDTLDWDRVEKRLDRIKALRGIGQQIEASDRAREAMHAEQMRLQAIAQDIEDDDEEIFMLL